MMQQQQQQNSSEDNNVVNPNRRVTGVNETSKSLTVQVKFNRSLEDEDNFEEENNSSFQQRRPQSNQNRQEQPRGVQQQQQQQHVQPHQSELSASTPSWIPQQQQQQQQQQQNESQWQALPPVQPAQAAQWAQAPPPDPNQQMIIGHWENPPAANEHQQGWAPAPAAATPIDQWGAPQGVADVKDASHWTNMPPPTMYAAPPTHTAPPPPPPSQQFMQIPFQNQAAAAPPQPLVIPMQQPDFMAAQPHLATMHHPHGALTQITHTQHSVPIMATQQFVPSSGSRNIGNGGSSSDPYYGRGYSRPSGGGGGRGSGWRDQSDRNTREVTRIPPRFQKQRPPPTATNSYNSEKAAGSTENKPRAANLPEASGSTPPPGCRRLTIFGTSNVVNNLSESDLAESLNIPVRLIPAMKLEAFNEKIGMVDPELDRLVLIHGLGNDARNIALKTQKNDVEKGVESDSIAHEFADTVIDLVKRIPYVKVLISTLLPRFDNEEQANMSNPNNVRKVMNVEISMKLADNPNVQFINNDTVLEWWKDDVKKMRLFGSDGYHLSAYGFSVMLGHWMKSLKEVVSKLNLTDGKLLSK